MKTNDLPKLVVAWMVEKDMDWMPLSIESVLPYADSLIIVDGNSTPRADWKNFVNDIPITVVNNRFPHRDVSADGIQRQKYLDVLLRNHLDSWCLVLDADEVFTYSGEKANLMLGLNEAFNNGFRVLSPRMEHFVGDFGHVDATKEAHFVPNRLFYVQKGLYYPPHEHSVLSHSDELKVGQLQGDICIWHINTARGVLRTMKKYWNNIHKSPVHSRDFLDWWYHSHALGKYPVRELKPLEVPKIIREYLSFNDDYLYFQGRDKLEVKHFIDAAHWRDHFKPASVLEIGCGMGPRVLAMKHAGMVASGVELSEWAVNHSLSPGNVLQGDILVGGDWGKHDLVVVYDVLEHIYEDDLKYALDTIKQHSNKHVLISVPFEGDPNLYNDDTHRIFRSRSWWEEQLEFAGLKVVDTPEHFLFRGQLIVCEVSK